MVRERCFVAHDEPSTFWLSILRFVPRRRTGKEDVVKRLNLTTGRYSWDDEYVWDSWANFQWAGFLAGRLSCLRASRCGFAAAAT